MPEGFRIATAYVEVKANVDDESARAAGQRVGDESAQGAQDSSKSGGNLAGKLLIAGIVAAAPVAGAAIIAGVGLGFIGLAALAEKNNAQVKASWTQLTTDLTAETKSAASDMGGSLAQGIGVLDQAALAAKPALADIFTAVKPDIPIIATGLAGIGTNLLPGLTAAARNSQPVILGTTNLLTELGTTGSDMLIRLSQNAGNLGSVFTSVGNIVHSAGVTVAGVASDLGTVWGQNASRMDSAIGGIGSAISGLASGAVPLLSGALSIVTNDVTMVTGALGPLTPLLGGVATSALLAWGAFKGASAVSGLVNSAGESMVNFGAKIENVSPKLGGLVGSVGIAATDIAGPLGAAVALGAVGLGIYSNMANQGAISSTDMASASSALTTALNQTSGAVTVATTGALKNTDAWKTLIPQLQQAGISQDEAIRAIEQGGPALDALNTKLGDTGTGQHNLSVETKGANTDLNNQAHSTSELKSNIDNLHGTFQQAVTDARNQAQAAQEAAAAQQNLNIQAVAMGGINFAGPAGDIAAALATIGNKASDDKQKVSALETELEALTNPGGAAISTLAGISTSEQGLADQLKGLKGPLTDQAGNLDLTSARGAAAATAIEGLATNYNQYIAQAEQAKVPTDQINQNLGTQYTNLLKTLEGFGLNETAAKNYLTQLGIIPPTASTAITTPGMQEAMANIKNLHGEIVGVPDGKTVTATALTSDAIAKLNALGYTVLTLPNGQFEIFANTDNAQGQISNFVQRWNGTTINLRVATTGAGSTTNLLHATGGITPRMHAAGDFTAVPNLAGFAAPGVPVSPNGGRDILGDRTDVSEAYIPMDNSARSGAILDQVNAAMPGHASAHSTTNTYAPVINMTGVEPAQVMAEMQSEFSWYNMIGRAA